MDLSRALDISAAGMSPPTSRLRVIAKTLADQDIGSPRGAARPADVDRFIAAMDTREVARGYDANLAVMRSTRGRLERAIAFLR
jgi:flagellar basal body rod protein FlgC